MKKKHIQKKKISRECWSLDYTFAKWLNEHLKVYLKDASKVVNLSYHKFTYKDKEYTQEELIKMLIDLTQKYMNVAYWEDDYVDYSKDICEIWGLILRAMWW